MCGKKDFVSAGNGFGFEHCLKDGRKGSSNEPAIEWVENQFVDTHGQLALSTRFFVKGPGNAFLKFTGRVGNVSSIKTQIVQMNHQFKVFGDMIFRPIFRKAMIL
eukprot:scaffold26910_cov127-Cylindrotheca_fusiformis.AAC.1